MNNSRIIDYLNNEFRPEEFADSDYTFNGLNVQNSGKITKIGVSVDTGIETFYEAKRQNVDFLITHHGIFNKNSNNCLTGAMYSKIKVLIDNDIALYCMHLPLDVNDEYSNNRVIMDLLSWDITGKFGDHDGLEVGLFSEFPESVNIEDIIEKVKSGIDEDITVWAFGDYLIKKAGVISGNGINMLNDAHNENIDLLITGEPSHKIYWQAYEKRIKCIFAGHYATEVFGVQKIGKYLAENFNLEYTFINLPTGV